MNRNKTFITYLIFMLIIPLGLCLSVIFLKEKHYLVVSVLVALLSIIPIFYSFERKENTSKELTALAVLVAISAFARVIFYWLPAFKPITALTIIVAIYFGKEAGFLLGSISALVSNMYFGQGPWTAFQMFSWGLIGFIAGLLYKPLKNSKIFLCIFGAFSGVLYSALMDVFTLFFSSNQVTFSKYLALLIAAAPTTITYMVSNIGFLLFLTKPIGKKLERLTVKYGLFQIVKNK